MNGPVNIEIVKEVAEGLSPLIDKLVFVGGAVVELYADDDAATPLRPTTDIDVVIELTGYGNYSVLEEKLSKLGFHHDPESKVTCRYLYKGITVDIMPTDEEILGFSNRWYEPGMSHINVHELSKEITIRLFEFPYFLASKFEAFKGRGDDPRTSHDFEDIIYVLDNRTDWVDEVLISDTEVRTYIKEEFESLLKDKFHREYISSHLPPATNKGRSDRIIEGLTEVVNS